MAVSGRREGAQGDPGFFLTDLGEMEIDHDRFERAVSEVGRDLPDRGPALEHVGGVTKAPRAGGVLDGAKRSPKGEAAGGAAESMAQGVHPEDLVFFVEPGFDLREMEGRPDS